MEAELVLAKKVEAEEWKNNPNNPLRDWVMPEL